MVGGWHRSIIQAKIGLKDMKHITYLYCCANKLRVIVLLGSSSVSAAVKPLGEHADAQSCSRAFLNLHQRQKIHQQQLSCCLLQLDVL